MSVDVKLLKAALEDAKFDDPDLRELVYCCINELDADLDDANYEQSTKVDSVWEDLEKYLEDHEEVEEPLVTDEDKTLAASVVDDEDDNDDEDDEDDLDEDEDDDDDNEDEDDEPTE